MDFRLKVFVTVATTGSFSKAAKELSISQPAVTKHIQILESTYSVQLFDRDIGKVKLTTRGEFFFRRANDILNGYDLLEIEMDSAITPHTKSIKIGVSETIADYLLSKIISRYITKNRSTRFISSYGTSAQILKELRYGEIDIAFVEHGSEHGNEHNNEDQNSFKSSIILQDKAVIVSRAETLLPKMISLEQFKKTPLILQHQDSDFAKFVDNELELLNISTDTLNIAMRPRSSEAVKSFITNSPIFLALLPYSAVKREIELGVINVVTVEDIEWQRNYMIIHSAHEFTHIAEELKKL